jgi:tRNA-dihydrouridine synthase 2
MELVDKIVATGVTALAIHCRTRDERPAEPAHWDRIQKIVKKHQDTLPIIVNGDVFHPEDIQKAKDITGNIT